MGYSCHNHLGPHHLCQHVLSFSCALRWTPERTLRTIKYKYLRNCRLTFSFREGTPLDIHAMILSAHHYLCQRVLSFYCALCRTSERTLRAIKHKYVCHFTFAILKQKLKLVMLPPAARAETLQVIALFEHKLAQLVSTCSVVLMCVAPDAGANFVCNNVYVFSCHTLVC